MYLYVWLALKEEEEEDEKKCKILAEVGSLCWNSEGELQKLSSRGQKVETLKKPWAPQCKSSEKYLFIWRISDDVYLASQVFAVVQFWCWKIKQPLQIKLEGRNSLPIAILTNMSFSSVVFIKFFWDWLISFSQI